MIGTAAQRPALATHSPAKQGEPPGKVFPAAPGRPGREAAKDPPPAPLPGVVVGTLTGIDASGRPLVDLPAACGGDAVAARTTVALSEREAGRLVVVMFERGNPAKPVILGMLQVPQLPERQRTPDTPEDPGTFQAKLDGERVELVARREIVLRCGQASITLTRAGKVLIRGAYVLSRSSGVNRIKGGSVQIN